MKSIILILIFIACCSIQLSSSTTGYKDTYRCENLTIGTLDIVENPFVRGGRRPDDYYWYDFVIWDRAPLGQVMVNVDVSVNIRGKVSRLKTRNPVSLFVRDVREEEASFASLMRIALGIPKYGTPPSGQVELDRFLFVSPCTVFFTNIQFWDDQFEYTFDITMSAKEGGKRYEIIKGTLIKPPK